MQKTMNIERICNVYKSGWFIITFVNFMFGISGMTVCTLKLKYAENDDTKEGFFKISLLFASSNLLLSIFLLVALIRNNENYAILYAFFSFMDMFFIVIYIESSTTADTTFLVIFSLFAFLCLLWFIGYGAYHLLSRSECEDDSSAGSFI